MTTHLKVFLAAILAIVVVLGGIWYSKRNNETSSNQSQVASENKSTKLNLDENQLVNDCILNNLPENQTGCLQALAYSKKDERFCQYFELTDKLRIQTDQERTQYIQTQAQNCYRELALLKKDISLCEKIEQQGVKDQCRSHFAEMDNDLSVCASLVEAGPRDSCYSGLGVKRQDFTVCDMAVMDIHKGNCYLAIIKQKKDSELCEKIADKNYRDYCLRDLAYIEGNEGVCKKIIDVKQREMCVNNFKNQ